MPALAGIFRVEELRFVNAPRPGVANATHSIAQRADPVGTVKTVAAAEFTADETRQPRPSIARWPTTSSISRPIVPTVTAIGSAFPVVMRNSPNLASKTRVSIVARTSIEWATIRICAYPPSSNGIFNPWSGSSLGA